MIEAKRKTNEMDGLMWFCENCNESIHSTKFKLTNVEKDFQPRFKEFYNSEDLRTCKKCNSVMQADKRFL